MIWGDMSSSGVGPRCLIKSKVNTAVYQDILEHFMLPSAHRLHGDADLILKQDLTTAHTARSTNTWFKDHRILCLIGRKLAWFEPHRKCMGHCQEEDETQDPTMQTSWRPLSKQAWASITPTEPNADWLMLKEPQTSTLRLAYTRIYFSDGQHFRIKNIFFTGPINYSNVQRHLI